MRFFVLFFTLGVWLAQQQSALPEWQTLIFMGIASVILFAAASFVQHRVKRLVAMGWLNGQSISRVVVLVAAAMVGFVWAAGLGQWRLADSLPLENEGRNILVTGVISSLPQRFENGVRFEFDVESADATVPSHLSLAWYRGWRLEEDDEPHTLQKIHAGERWQFTVRLKRPHGNLNPHSFDYEAWLFERNVRATGYVRPSAESHPNKRITEFVPRAGLAVERSREWVRERFLKALPEQEYVGVLIALVVGDQQAIDSDLWQVFSRTGITHLMSISGLHVTMVAGIGWWLVSFFWRRQPRLMVLLPAQKAAAVGGWLTGFFYCLLAGFGVPAQRTLYMLSVVAVALLLGRMTSASRVLALALLVVLLLDPWAVLSAGFWLSFGAVSLLFYVSAGRVGRTHWLAEWGRTQWAITLGMIPALLALFQQFSLVSPLANAVAIPVVSFIVTPLALIGAVLPFDLPLQLAHWVMTALMMFIEWLATLPAAVWQQHAPPLWTVALATLGCAWMLLPRGFPSRWVGLVLCAPLIFMPPLRPTLGTLKLTVLDVGQGLAVHVQTAHHDLLYDTGPQFSPDANSGNRIILPYLRAIGVSKLDGLVISHQDKDHSGGAQSVMEAVPIDWVASSVVAEHPLRAAIKPNVHRACFDGQSWDWDGVHFEMLHPQFQDYAQSPSLKVPKTNDMSCVLKISAVGQSVLLTSDIEAISERALLARHATALKADWLVAPHHGSRTSSTEEFIKAIGAKTVIFSMGYRNRFRHPNKFVVQRYEETGAELLRSDRDGAISLQIPPKDAAIQLERVGRRRYWHSQ